MDLSTADIVLLLVAAVTAGWMNAISGGGGLVQLPAVMLVFPHAMTLDAMATNKTAAFTGTSASVATYLREHRPDWRFARQVVLTAFAAAAVAAVLMTRISTDFLRPAVFVVLLGVWLFTVFGRPAHEHEVFDTPNRGRALAVAAVVGFYDGMVGPGTGAFLLIGYVTLVGLSFLGASVLAKITNGASNLASVVVLGVAGYIHWPVAIAMAGANALGGVFGARMALARGSSFVRIVFLLTTGPLILRLGWSLWA